MLKLLPLLQQLLKQSLQQQPAVEAASSSRAARQPDKGLMAGGTRHAAAMRQGGQGSHAAGQPGQAGWPLRQFFRQHATAAAAAAGGGGDGGGGGGGGGGG